MKKREKMAVLVLMLIARMLTEEQDFRKQISDLANSISLYAND